MTLADFAIYTAALSGMHAGEVLALTYKRFINVDNKTVSVTKSKTNRVPINTLRLRLPVQSEKLLCLTNILSN